MSERKGFTLIELLVVISIIAVLLSILMPALNSAKQQAGAVICKANLKQWGLVTFLYLENYDGKMCSGGYGMEVTGGDEIEAHWQNALRPYYEIADFRLCPVAKKPAVPLPGATTEDEGLGSARTAWGHLNVPYCEPGLYGSYGLNIWFYGPTTTDNSVWPGRTYTWFWGARNITNVRKPDNVPMFLDCADQNSGPWHSDTPPTYDGDFYVGGWWAADMKSFCMDRHRGYVNSVFADASVRRVGLKELWTLKWHKQFDTNNYWTQPGADWPPWLRKFEDY